MFGYGYIDDIIKLSPLTHKYLNFSEMDDDIRSIIQNGQSGDVDEISRDILNVITCDIASTEFQFESIKEQIKDIIYDKIGVGRLIKDLDLLTFVRNTTPLKIFLIDLSGMVRYIEDAIRDFWYGLKTDVDKDNLLRCIFFVITAGKDDVPDFKLLAKIRSHIIDKLPIV